MKKKGLNHALVKASGIVTCFALSVFLAGIECVAAYTYTYHNRTSYPVQVVVEFYEDGDKTVLIEASKSQTISHKSLLRSWSAGTSVENRWIKVLNLTCDFLPGDHTFSIYVKESKDNKNEIRQSWYVITGNDLQAAKLDGQK